MWNRSIVMLFAGSALCACLGACVLDLKAAHDQSPNPTYSIGGQVVGASGPFALQNSNGTNLIVSADGSFVFETEMVSSALYNVTIAVPPHSRNCSVANGKGTVQSADISNITVICSPSSYKPRNRLVAGRVPKR